jgi:hypothetical protein
MLDEAGYSRKYHQPAVGKQIRRPPEITQDLFS